VSNWASYKDNSATDDGGLKSAERNVAKRPTVNTTTRPPKTVNFSAHLEFSAATGILEAKFAASKELELATQVASWYVDFFRNDYLQVYDHQFTAERAEKEVAFAERALQLSSGSHVLDLCCGQGRHSVLLAKHGFQVTGIDLNREYLELTQNAARAAGVKVETVAADMREIPAPNKFDAIVNMYSSFGYLESEAEDLRVLESAAQALKPGGRLLLDMLNREWAVANYVQNDWHKGADGTIYVERRDLDLASSSMHVSFTIVSPDGRRRDSIGHHIRLYTLTEITRLLQRVGLSLSGVFGGFDSEPYAISTRRMIVLAQKDA
jgi:2-polyprenyl-3-methyl-5-hydroxy-6-metoxy-1,4-benzoquinol methylase